MVGVAEYLARNIIAASAYKQALHQATDMFTRDENKPPSALEGATFDGKGAITNIKALLGQREDKDKDKDKDDDEDVDEKHKTQEEINGEPFIVPARPGKIAQMILGDVDLMRLTQKKQYDFVRHGTGGVSVLQLGALLSKALRLKHPRYTKGKGVFVGSLMAALYKGSAPSVNQAVFTALVRSPPSPPPAG